MKIYESRNTPNCRRVTIFLAEKGITDIEFEQLDLQRGDNLSDEFKARNPFKGVPVLELDDGSHLSESVAICRYFEELQPEPPLFGSGARQRAEIEMWNRRVELGFFLPVAYVFRHGTGFFKDRETVVPAWAEANRPAIAAGYRLLNRQLAEQAWLCGEQMSIADITAYCAVEFAGGTGSRIPEDCEHVTRWFRQMRQRPSVKPKQ